MHSCGICFITWTTIFESIFETIHRPSSRSRSAGFIPGATIFMSIFEAIHRPACCSRTTGRLIPWAPIFVSIFKAIHRPPFGSSATCVPIPRTPRSVCATQGIDIVGSYKRLTQILAVSTIGNCKFKTLFVIAVFLFWGLTYQG